MPAAPLLLTLLLLSAPQAPGVETEDDLTLPDEVAAFVEPGTRAIDFIAGDLDRDGRQDGILVLEETSPRDADEPSSLNRVVILLLRRADGSFERVVRNDRAIYCSDCGGMMGDPYVGIETAPGRFTIHHYGGSAWRWGISTTFAVGEDGRSWKLARVATESFHASDPGNSEDEAYDAPAQISPVEFHEFDLETWRDGIRE